MGTNVHIINAHQGNMVLIEAASGEAILCDCNVTWENEERVLAYVRQVLGGRRIRAFINTHRDADHMRGVNRVEKAVGIDTVWDSGLPGGTAGCSEYEEYMRLRRAKPRGILHSLTYHDLGATRVRVLSAASPSIADDSNAQSIVLKIEHASPQNSILLTGDSDVSTWNAICASHRHMMYYLSSEILLASHHGSWSFFDCGIEGKHLAEHVRAINPAMTVVSVGKNPHKHPDPTSLVHYEHYSRGDWNGYRVWRTDQDGTMRLKLRDTGIWNLDRWQDAHLARDRDLETFLKALVRPAPQPLLQPAPKPQFRLTAADQADALLRPVPPDPRWW